MDVAKETDVIQLSGLFFYFAAVTEMVMDSLETTDAETTTVVSGLLFSYFAAVDVAEITTAAASNILKEEQFYPVPLFVFSSDLRGFTSNGI